MVVACKALMAVLILYAADVADLMHVLCHGVPSQGKVESLQLYQPNKQYYQC